MTSCYRLQTLYQHYLDFIKDRFSCLINVNLKSIISRSRLNLDGRLYSVVHYLGTELSLLSQGYNDLSLISDCECDLSRPSSIQNVRAGARVKITDACHMGSEANRKVEIALGDDSHQMSQWAKVLPDEQIAGSNDQGALSTSHDNTCQEMTRQIVITNRAI